MALSDLQQRAMSQIEAHLARGGASRTERRELMATARAEAERVYARTNARRGFTYALKQFDINGGDSAPE